MCYALSDDGRKHGESMQVDEKMKYKDINGLEKIMTIAHVYVRYNH